MDLANIPHSRQKYLPQTPEQVKKKEKPTPTSWADAARKKEELEKAVRELAKSQTKLVKDRELVDKLALEYHQAIPLTDGTLYSECPYSKRRIDMYMARSMYKSSEDLFRWLAPKTFQAVTEIKTFLDEMLPALDWGMKMKAIEEKLKVQPKIGQDTPEEIF